MFENFRQGETRQQLKVESKIICLSVISIEKRAMCNLPAEYTLSDKVTRQMQRASLTVENFILFRTREKR